MKLFSIILLAFLLITSSYGATLKKNSLSTNKKTLQKKKKTHITVSKIKKPVIVIRKPIITVKKPVVKTTKPTTKKPVFKVATATKKPIFKSNPTPSLTKGEPKITKPLFKTGQKRLESPTVLKSAFVTPTKSKVKQDSTPQANKKALVKNNTPKTPKNVVKQPKFVFVLPVPPQAKKIKMPRIARR